MEIDEACIRVPWRRELPDLFVGRFLLEMEEPLQILLRADIISWKAIQSA
jgi:hypothetical protein